MTLRSPWYWITRGTIAGFPGSAVLLFVVMVAFVAGCGSGDALRLIPLEGTVTHQGARLTHGLVVLTPEGGTSGPQAVGRIESDGTFQVKTAGGDGVVADGTFVVTVICRRVPTPEEARDLVVTPSLIPERYGRSDETPLRYEATDKEHDYAIELD